MVPIDAGAFNIGFPGIEGLCSFVRRHLPQTKILYYFPPGSWRRTLKSSPLAALTDAVATPFSWSETELRRFGVNATFVGHPLLDLVHPSGPIETFAERLGIDREHPVIGILPGSRLQEIEAILPVQLAAASIIYQRVPGAQFLIAQAPTVARAAIERAIEQEQARRKRETGRPMAHSRRDDEGAPLLTIPLPADGSGPLPPGDFEEQRKKWIARASELPAAPTGNLPVVIVEDATYDMMALSDVLLVTSGTATLEAAILGRPMVITYRMAQNNWLEYQFVKGRLPRFVGMPNILAERMICPELLQEAATPEALASEIIGLLLEPDRILRMRDDLKKAVSLLGTPGGAARTAKMVVELAEGGNASSAKAVE